MADSAAFTQICKTLESSTSFSRIEARGTVRLALKSAGLTAMSVTADQMQVVLEWVIPTELANRGIPNPDEVCGTLARCLAEVVSEKSHETPESVFDRLGGS